MDSKFIRGLSAGVLVVALCFLLPSGTQAQQRSGVEIWEANCSRCHMLQPTNKFYPKDWRSVGMHMTITARLTSAQSEAVIAFLISGARTDATAALTGTPAPSSPAVPASVAVTGEQVALLREYINRLEGGPKPAVTPK